MSHFDEYLADCARSGNRYNLLPRLTASGKASGMTADEIVERARAVGIRDRDRDIRRLYNGSTADPSNRSSSWRPSRPSVPILTQEERAEARCALLPKAARNFVPVYLRDLGRKTDFGDVTLERSTADVFAQTLRATNAALGLDAAAYRLQAARHLRAMFRPGDLIWAGFKPKDGYKTAYDGVPLRDGGGVVEAHDLARRIEAGTVATIPTHISLNPITGRAVDLPDAKGGGTHPSYNCKETVARYCHALIEYDHLFEIDAQGMKVPSMAQVEIAAGIFNSNKISAVVCYSTGGKSIHSVLKVRGETLEEYEEQLAHLRNLFISADDPIFRADPAPFKNHATLCRLAGAIRSETNRHARLLWDAGEF